LKIQGEIYERKTDGALSYLLEWKGGKDEPALRLGVKVGHLE